MYGTRCMYVCIPTQLPSCYSSRLYRLEPPREKEPRHVPGTYTRHRTRIYFFTLGSGGGGAPGGKYSVAPRIELNVYIQGQTCCA